MASLTAHLLESEDHGRLGFHPRCPVCREGRLFGVLANDAVVARRAQAALAAGVLAVAAAGAPVAAAQEGDRQSEGEVAPVDPGVGAPESPGFDPGGETTLPNEAQPLTAPAPEAQPPDGTEPQDSVPLESEPVQDPGAELVAPPEPELQDPSTPPPPAPEPPVVPAPSLPVEGLQAPPDAEEAPPPPVEDPIPPKADKDGHPDPAPRDRAAPPAPIPAPVTVAPPVEVVPVAEVDVQAVEAQPDGGLPSLKGAPSHVVQPGDSLWSIAKRLLGSGAPTAQLAREVDRLWRLNAGRIGTGDPDLLMVGTKLRLR